MKSDLQAPFPYFGGKSAIADRVWAALGNPERYIEPFFGSGAVLLRRPAVGKSEIVCDKDGYVANVWRALQFAPDETAKWCDWPCNHADLMARKARLLSSKSELLARLISDDTYHDPLLAGYWIWCASNWIGSGLTRPTQIPHLTDERGINKTTKRPHLTTERGEPTDPYNEGIYTWVRQLSQRLRYVKVVCGDWTRVCGGNWQQGGSKTCGIFFDPPYSLAAGRDNDLYDEDSGTVAVDVAKWAAERGDKPGYRIVIAGYQGEHEWLLERRWTAVHWQAVGGYSSMSHGKNGNRKKEMLWFSPQCGGQKSLFQ